MVQIFVLSLNRAFVLDNLISDNQNPLIAGIIKDWSFDRADFVLSEKSKIFRDVIPDSFDYATIDTTKTSGLSHPDLRSR